MAESQKNEMINKSIDLLHQNGYKISFSSFHNFGNTRISNSVDDVLNNKFPQCKYIYNLDRFAWQGCIHSAKMNQPASRKILFGNFTDNDRLFTCHQGYFKNNRESSMIIPQNSELEFYQFDNEPILKIS